MAVFLLAWNPKKWTWPKKNLAEAIRKTKSGGDALDNWSFGRSQKARIGDRVFLIKLGQAPKGLVASGFVVGAPRLGAHYQDAKKPSQVYVRVRWDRLVDGYKSVVVAREELDESPFSKQHWDTQVSGISIKPHVAAALELLWMQRLGILCGPWYGEEESNKPVFVEGCKLRVMVNRYERDPIVRAKCIERFGAYCSVCETDLKAIYGDVAAGFIHVHHLTPLAKIGKGSIIDPKKDLRPVCPNCHAIIHRGNPPYSIETVKSFLKCASRKRT